MYYTYEEKRPVYEDEFEKLRQEVRNLKERIEERIEKQKEGIF